MDLTGSGGDSPGTRRWPPRLATIAFLAVVGGFTLISQRPPPALPADAPADAFSAGRAMPHVEAIARVPHPLGSAAEEPVRAYIIGELKDLGFEPEIQRPRDTGPTTPETMFNPWRHDVQNIVARWRSTGPEGKKALLLSAHYDSVERGPGAGDDASGVAAILESLRRLKSAHPQRDIIILINDGEEAGMLGAEVFAAEHPWSGNVGAVLNFDARGNSGPSFMFETSDDNGWLIEQMAPALPHPMATSLTMEVYRLMPNDTDLTVYKQHGMAGWNFAFVGGLHYYHSPQDTPANLDPRTLQHQGENLLSMARHLVRLDLDEVRRDDVVYFSILQRYVAIYPLSWVMPLLGNAALAYAAVLALGVAKARVRLAEVAAGFATFLAALLAAMIAVSVLWLALGGLLVRTGIVVDRPDLEHGKGMPVSRYDVVLLAGSAVVAVLIVAAVFVRSSRRWGWEGLGLGVLLWWLAVAAAASIGMPGASYAFAWPLLAILIAQAVAFLVPRGGPVALVASWLGAVPLLVIQLVIIDGTFNGLNIRLAPFLMIPVVLVAAALVPVAAQAMRGGPHPGSLGERRA